MDHDTETKNLLIRVLSEGAHQGILFSLWGIWAGNGLTKVFPVLCSTEPLLRKKLFTCPVLSGGCLCVWREPWKCFFGPGKGFMVHESETWSALKFYQYSCVTWLSSSCSQITASYASKPWCIGNDCNRSVCSLVHFRDDLAMSGSKFLSLLYAASSAEGDAGIGAFCDQFCS